MKRYPHLYENKEFNFVGELDPGKPRTFDNLIPIVFVRRIRFEYDLSYIIAYVLSANMSVIHCEVFERFIIVISFINFLIDSKRAQH